MLEIEMLDTILSLNAIMAEESLKLTAPGRHPDLPELAAAKVRLVASLETETARLNREKPDWMEELDGDARTGLAQTIAQLRETAAANAAVLGRRIALSTEMMAAVAAEAQRLTGTSSATYGAHGSLFQLDQATPISLNARI